MTAVRILVTGSREWTDRSAVSNALSVALGPHSAAELPELVHGAARGADAIADELWRTWMRAGVAHHRGGAFAEPEKYPARDFPSPRARNQHMVDLGATVCLAFALDWASGTGMCARMARAAGIPVVDLGVGTASRRPS